MAFPTTLDSFSTKTDNSTTVAAADVNDLQTAVVAVETALGYGGTVPVSTATNSTIVKRDSSAGAAFAAVTATTVAASSTVTGTGGVLGPRSSGAAVFALDAGATGSTVAIANNGSATPFGATANFSGLFIVNDTATDGVVAVFATGGNAMVKVAETLANVYTITQATASRVNVFLNTQVVTIENKTGATRTFSVMALRSRNGN